MKTGKNPEPSVVSLGLIAASVLVGIVVMDEICQSTKESVGMGIEEKGIPEVLVRSVMCLYEGEKIRVNVDSELSEEFEVKVGMHQGSVLSLFLSAVVVDVVTEFARDGALSELLYSND